jgi:hypothetical protein
MIRSMGAIVAELGPFETLLVRHQSINEGSSIPNPTSNETVIQVMATNDTQYKPVMRRRLRRQADLYKRAVRCGDTSFITPTI